MRVDGKFLLDNVPIGTYQLDVYHELLEFDQYRIDVSARDAKVTVQNSRNEKQPELLVILPIGVAVYYAQRDSFNFLALIMNPMGIMAIVGLFMILIFPRIIGNMDPAELEALKKQQAEMNPMNMLNSFKQSMEESSNSVEHKKKK